MVLFNWLISILLVQLNIFSEQNHTLLIRFWIYNNFISNVYLNIFSQGSSTITQIICYEEKNKLKSLSSKIVLEFWHKLCNCLFRCFLLVFFQSQLNANAMVTNSNIPMDSLSHFLVPQGSIDHSCSPSQPCQILIK